MSSPSDDRDQRLMSRALELALKGQGCVEPNPMVGCVIAQAEEIVGEGWHRQFGGPHAEIAALQAARERASGAEVFVTLEPCCHQGKTGPCTQALIEARVARVVVGCRDPNPQVAGKGIAMLRNAGIDVEESSQSDAARQLIAPFEKLVTTGRPWAIAKWAMTLDGKIATRTGSSQWISSEESRARVHQLRGRVDGILVGRGTAEADDPLLTARPAGPRVATRVVLDTNATLSIQSQLVQTAAEVPLLVAVGEHAPSDRRRQLESEGAEVLECAGQDRQQRLDFLLSELGKRQMTNLLVEGGAEVLGTLFDMQAFDEVLVFIASKLIGGDGANPIAGQGLEQMADALQLSGVRYEQSGDDLCVSGRLKKLS